MTRLHAIHWLRQTSSSDLAHSKSGTVICTLKLCIPIQQLRLPICGTGRRRFARLQLNDPSVSSGHSADVMTAGCIHIWVATAGDGCRQQNDTVPPYCIERGLYNVPWHAFTNGT